MENNTEQQDVMILLKVMFGVRVVLWIVAAVATAWWIGYDIKLRALEIFDPYEFASLFRPVFYTCIIISVAAICIAFAIRFQTVKIKKKNNIFY